MNMGRWLLLSVLASCTFFDGDDDDDGVRDADERAAGTDPTLADSDGDGLGDADEASWGTDPLRADSDADGGADGDEVAVGTDPLDAASGPYPTGWPQLSDAARDAWEDVPTCAAGEVVSCRAPDVTLPEFRGFEFRLRDLAAADAETTLLHVASWNNSNTDTFNWNRYEELSAWADDNSWRVSDFAWLNEAVAAGRTQLVFVAHPFEPGGEISTEDAWRAGLGVVFQPELAVATDPLLWDRDGALTEWLGVRRTPHFLLLDRELRVIARDYFDEAGPDGLNPIATILSGRWVDLDSDL
jgi:hypothetical protein